MRPQFFLGLGCLVLLLLVAACGAGAPATPTPRTSNAPVATPAPGPTTAASGPIVAPSQAIGATCAGAPASLTPDADLAARFPQQIDGQPVTGVETYNWMQFMCALAGQTAIDAWKTEIPVRFHSILTGLSYGSADVTLDGESVEISAFRAVGTDADTLAVLYDELSQMVSGELPSGSASSTSYATIGGKEVTVRTDEDGRVAYLYRSTDALFSVTDVTESQAGKIFAALP